MIKRPITKYTITLLLAVLLIQFFNLDLINSVFIFILGPIYIILGIGIFIGLIWSITFFIKGRKEIKNAHSPFIIITITIVCIILTPMSELRLYLDFYNKLSNRIEVVKSIEGGTIKYDLSQSCFVDIPDGYKNLSAGINNVSIENIDGQLCIYFYTFRGLTDNNAGFVYVPDEKIIKFKKIGVSYGNCVFYELTLIRKIKKNWYFIQNT